MSKGSSRRPGIVPPGAWEAVFSPIPCVSPAPCERCGDEEYTCQPTEDGPGDEAGKLPYDQRTFNREGV